MESDNLAGQRVPISVVIPVGPEPQHRRWLKEAIESVDFCTPEAAEIIIVDDMAGLPLPFCHTPIRMWGAPWRLGVATAFNIGVALAHNECVFLLGSDDRLLRDCLGECWASYEKNDRQPGFYGVGVEYSDGREDQFAPCNAAMVTQEFWRQTGGFPIEAASGAPDAALLSILLGQAELPDPIMVNAAKPLYWYRVHDESDTAGRGPWQGVILETRNRVTDDWKPPAWGRFSVTKATATVTRDGVPL